MSVIPRSPSSSANPVNEKRTSAPGVAAANWEATEAGGYALLKSRPEDSVSLKYESPEQIALQRRADREAERAQEQAAKKAAVEAEKASTTILIGRVRASAERATANDLRRLEYSNLDDLRRDRRKIQVAGFANAVSAHCPGTAYVAFEAETEYQAAADGNGSSFLRRRAVFLDENFVSIGSIVQDASQDTFGNGRTEHYSIHEEGSPELNRLFANVFPVVSDPEMWDERDSALFSRELMLTDATRAFNDGTRPNVPNLLTMEGALDWKPEEVVDMAAMEAVYRARHGLDEPLVPAKKSFLDRIRGW